MWWMEDVCREAMKAMIFIGVLIGVGMAGLVLLIYWLASNLSITWGG